MALSPWIEISMIHRIYKLRFNNSSAQGKYMLILVRGLNLQYGFDMNHLWEIWPLCAFFASCPERRHVSFADQQKYPNTKCCPFLYMWLIENIFCVANLLHRIRQNFLVWNICTSSEIRGVPRIFSRGCFNKSWCCTSSDEGRWLDWGGGGVTLTLYFPSSKFDGQFSRHRVGVFEHP